MPVNFRMKIITVALLFISLLSTFFFMYHFKSDSLWPRSIQAMNVTEGGDCMTNSSQRFSIFPAGHGCLHVMSNRLCYDGHVVPNLVHYINFNQQHFYFYNLLSVLSSYRILHPCFIFLHGNVIPEGKWWDHLLELVPNIVFIRTEAPKVIFQHKVEIVQHQSDVTRLRVILEYGGIYMDTDEIALKSFDPLRKYQVTVSRSRRDTIGNAVIIAQKEAPFLRIWYLTYNFFDDKQWGYHSCILPYKLATAVPNLVHMEEYNFFGFPKSVYYIFQGICEWKHRYAIHLYYTLQKKKNVKDFSPEEIKNQNTTFGEVARFIYFGQLPKRKKAKC